MEHFSFLPPAQPGWNVGKVSDAERSFFRADSSKAWLDIKDEEDPQCTNVRQALAQYGERFKNNWECRVKVMAFQSGIDAHDGNERLHNVDATTARVNPPIATGHHMTEHSLVCIYGENPNRLLTTTYLYHAEDDTDPRKQKAQDSFAGLRFARQQAKLVPTLDHSRIVSNGDVWSAGLFVSDCSGPRWNALHPCPIYFGRL